MAKNNNLTDFLTGVAGAIRTKKGTSSLINPQNFESEISSIKTEKPEQEKSISISTNGTTEVTPDIGKVLSKVSVTTNVQPTLQEKTVAPTTTQQIVTADSGKDGLSKVTVNAVTSSIDSSITAENIKKDVTILGVTGTLESGGGGIDTSDATATADDILAGKTAYINGVKVDGTIEVYEGENFEFWIGGTSFYSAIGMTWEQWANSDYNTEGYIANLSGVYLTGGRYDSFIQYNSVDVSMSDNIIKGGTYTVARKPSSGGSAN